jgi:hypothetical protein
MGMKAVCMTIHVIFSQLTDHTYPIVNVDPLSTYRAATS